MISLADVARRAGVSITTASRVMSESPHPVAEQTRRRVLEAADALDFEPNLVARGLVAQRTSMVALLMGDVTDPSAALVTRGVEDIAFEHGFSLLVGDTDGDTEKEVAYVRKLRALRADAVLLATPALEGDPQLPELTRQLRQIEGAGGVVVRLGPAPDDASDVSWSRRRAFELLVAHLRDLGHRELALVAGPARYGVTAASVDACRAAAAAHGMALPDERVVVVDEVGKSGTKRAAALARDATAVLTTSDECAGMVMAALRAGGSRIPEDVSVTGLGDLRVAALLTPAVTTVRLPHRDLGRAGMLYACNILEGKPRPAPAELVVNLVVRDSTAPPRGSS